MSRRQLATAILIGFTLLSLAGVRGSRPTVAGGGSSMYAWGYNRLGRFGNGMQGDVEAAPVPVAPPAGVSFSTVSAGEANSLALATDGTVYAWGNNAEGELGNGGTANSLTPVRVCAVGQTAPCTSFLSGIVAIAAGSGHSLALSATGTVYAWGRNANDELGNGVSQGPNISIPAPVCAGGQTAPCSSFLTGITAIATHASTQFNLALGAGGAVYAWGANGSGQLGNGDTNSKFAPVPVCATGQSAPCGSFLTGISAISADGANGLALGAGGAVFSWGYGGNGALGNGSTADSHEPVPVCAVGQIAPCGSLLTGITAISVGEVHSLALGAAGAVFSWGAGFFGELGNGSSADSHAPLQVCAVGQTAPCTSFLTGITAISAGEFFSLAVNGAGLAYAWGSNSVSQLGDGATTDRSVPVGLCAAGQTAPCSSFLSGITIVSAGSQYALALAAPQPPRSSSAGVHCAPATLAVNGSTTCTTTVTDTGAGAPSAPTGTVTLSNGGAAGQFSPANGQCVLANPTAASATCQLTYRPTASGTQAISASYPGDAMHATSTSSGAGNATLTVGLFVYQPQPSASMVGKAMPFQPAIALVDGANMPIPSFTEAVTVAIKPGSGPGTLSGTTTVVAVAGVATFTNLAIDTIGSGYVLTGSATGGATVDSLAFKVLPIPSPFLDGVPTPLGAQCILRQVAGLSGGACGAGPLPNGDVNGNGAVTPLDAQCVLRYIAALAPTSACPFPPGP
ncbi:MAG: hypothetical protein ACYDCQ_05705 [Dehalococcoidia bacterium]